MPNFSEKLCPVTPMSSGDDSHFFGYFDKSPWNSLDPSVGVLAHRTRLHHHMPLPEDPVEIGLINNSRAFDAIDKSFAWNFQQGCMLQWKPRSLDNVLFNDRNHGRAVGVCLDLSTSNRTTYPRAFAAVSPRGDEALSLDFSRLTFLKSEYGYAGIEHEFPDDPCPENAGLWRMDLSSGETKLLVSLREVMEIDSEPGALGSIHYFNHVLYNRSGARFCFLHRYINPAGTQKTRLFVCNRDGTGLRLLISGMASHFGWRNDRELLVWAGERALMKSATGRGWIARLPVGGILKKLYRALGKPAALKAGILNDRYILFDVETGSGTTVGKGVLVTDGHCSFSPDGRWFITDTYPDRSGNAHVLMCELESGVVHRVAGFSMPPGLDGEIRCDLHPRWHPSEPLICVDSGNEMTRQMYVIDVSHVLHRC